MFHTAEGKPNVRPPSKFCFLLRKANQMFVYLQNSVSYCGRQTKCSSPWILALKIKVFYGFRLKFIKIMIKNQKLFIFFTKISIFYHKTIIFMHKIKFFKGFYTCKLIFYVKKQLFFSFKA